MRLRLPSQSIVPYWGWLTIAGPGWWVTLFYSPAALAADAPASSYTGIPIEWLFAVVGALGSMVYLDVKREIRALHKEGESRTRQINRIRDATRDICHKLNIRFSDHEDDQP